jgi:hypothetical protein
VIATGVGVALSGFVASHGGCPIAGSSQFYLAGPAVFSAIADLNVRKSRIGQVAVTGCIFVIAWVWLLLHYVSATTAAEHRVLTELSPLLVLAPLLVLVLRLGLTLAFRSPARLCAGIASMATSQLIGQVAFELGRRDMVGRAAFAATVGAGFCFAFILATPPSLPTQPITDTAVTDSSAGAHSPGTPTAMKRS